MVNPSKSLTIKFLLLVVLMAATMIFSLPATQAQDFCNDRCVRLDDGTKGCLVNGGGGGIGCRLTSTGCVNINCNGGGGGGGEGPGPILP